MSKFGIFLCFVFLVLTGFGCEDNEKANGTVLVNIEHLIDGTAIDFDEMKYVNAAGNTYEVNEIQWFVSDITLKKENGNMVELFDENNFAHYIDTDIPSTMEILLSEVNAGKYGSVILTFGIKGSKNLPGAFPNPPESLMIWPFHMGGDNGGYHYMKLNGFWKNPEEMRQPFNFHLGVGKVEETFIQNWFELEIDALDFTVKEGKETRLALEMNVENWFVNPNVYNHNEFGGMIMNNQLAMGTGCENGQTGVFEIRVLDPGP